MYHILISCLRISKNFDFFLQLPVLNVSSAHFLSFFSVLLLSLPQAFRILSGCREKVGVSYGQGLEMGPSTIRGILGHFTTIFAPKLIYYVRIPPIAKTDCFEDRSILALPSAHQENPVTFKLMTSQVVLKEHDHSVCHVWLLRCQRVNMHNQCRRQRNCIFMLLSEAVLQSPLSRRYTEVSVEYRFSFRGPTLYQYGTCIFVSIVSNYSPTLR